MSDRGRSSVTMALGHQSLAAALAAVTLVFLSCGGSGTVEIADSDAGKTVELQVGQTLVITLQGLGTAGYLWEVTSTPGPTLEQIGDRETLSPTSGAAGASARESFRFRAARTGQTTLTLADRRPFGSREVAKTFEVTVRVR